jgi:oligopeptide transport system substrate-binding protein
VLFRSHTGAEYNTGGYSNPDVDSLLDKAGIEQDQSARFLMYQQAEQQIVNEAACLPLFFGKSYILIKPYVNNYKLDIQGIPTLKEVTISE